MAKSSVTPASILVTEVVNEGEAIVQMKSKVKPESVSVPGLEVLNAVEAVEEPVEAVLPENPSAPQSVTLTTEQLQTLMNHAVQTAIAEATQQTQAENEMLRTQLHAATEERRSLESVFEVLGHPTPSRRPSASSKSPQGLAQDFMQACEAAPNRVWVDKTTGDRIVQRDMSQARYLFFHEREQLRHDLEHLAKQNGFLQGAGYVASDAPTVRGDVLPLFLDYLSLTLRETHSARYVYWQFPYYNLELGKGPGDTIQVPRFRWLTEAVAVADRTLNPANTIAAGSNPVQAFSVSITLGERGLGFGTPASNLAVAVPEFLTAYSMLNLENAVMSRLGHDYEAWEDLSVRSLLFASTRIVYNDRASVTTVPGNVGAGDDGTLSEAFLNMLYAYMAGLQIPPLDDGNYILVLHDVALAQLKNSMANRNRYTDRISVQELTGLLQSAANREMGKTSGYVGTVGNFHVFATNAHSMGVAGTSGVQNETLGAGSTLTRTSFAMGRAALARAIGLEAEVRQDNNNDFGRLNRFIWLSHETTGYLDTDPAIAAEQQLRVIQIRTTDQNV